MISYRALDPAAWLKRHKPNPRVMNAFRLNPKKPIILLRTEEAFASYLAGKASDSAPVIGPVVREILELGLKVQIIVSTRYGQQAPVLRKMFGRRIRVIDRVVDAASLLDHSTVFIGSGGTMTVEAALLGKPAISCFPGEKPLYIKYLEKQGLVRTLKDPKKIALEVKRILSSPDFLKEQKRRGRTLLVWMEDPIAKISKVVMRAAND